MLPGCTLDIPPEPAMTNDVGMTVPPDGAPRSAAAPPKGVSRTYPPVVSTI
jgi:hypothetical protein